jgi:D-amino peptidase
MKFFILTDLEGVVGVDSFSQTRTDDVSMKGPGMKQLAREVNACIAGIRDVFPDAEVDVWDGHGSGGLFAEDVQGGRYLPGSEKPYFELEGFAAMLFVGQHAMAGTINAPLCHTYSSRNVAYYKLNGVYIGEFGARALIAGLQGVPTIFLSGDDKAALEAQMFIPEIETAVVKWGQGLEAARHLSSDEACRIVREGAARAVRRMGEIPPFTAIRPPFTLEMRYYNPIKKETWIKKGAEIVDDRTVVLTGDHLRHFPL